jgi:hypothetical protein
MKIVSTVAAITLSLSLTACAKSPSSIAPVSMAGMYDNLSCKKARTMLEQERQTLSALESQQKSARTGDAIGVFLILVPVSSLTGADREGAIATSKGKTLALEARVQECS